MNKMKTNLGWITAGVLGGVLIFSGFGQAQEKFGVVDLNRMLAESKLGKRNTEAMKSAIASREALLAFMNDYPILTEEQALALKGLSVKPVMTEAEKKQEEQIKNDIKADGKLFNDLNQKPNPTEAERSKLSEFNKRGGDTQRRLQQWKNMFNQDISDLGKELQKTEITNAKAALDEVAKKGGYSIVLELQVAPYGANDVTDEGIKALDAKTN
jgi:Skp family chaperone for outer membrane proteins